MTSDRVDDLQHQASLVRASLLGQIAERRKSLGLTQGEVSERTGSSRMTVQRAEAEGADTQLSTFVQMSLALGITPSLAGAGNSDGNVEQAPEDIVHRGYHYVRTLHDLDWRDRQREAALAKSWEAVNEHRVHGLSPILPTLVPGHTQAQASAVATIVQWLGTEVGFDFLTRALDQAGYDVVDKKKKK
jgi:transcriptional regulator with XRE-family HTH domain